MRRNSSGGMPSRDRKPCSACDTALRGRSVSQTSTRRRHRPRTSAALRPAGPAPTTTTSQVSVIVSSKRTFVPDLRSPRAGYASGGQGQAQAAEPRQEPGESPLVLAVGVAEVAHHLPLVVPWHEDLDQAGVRPFAPAVHAMGSPTRAEKPTSTL